jgi:hypothetical protein
MGKWISSLVSGALLIKATSVWTSYIGGTQDTVFDTIHAFLPEFLNPDELTVENRCLRWLSMELRRPLSAFTGLYELIVSIAGALCGTSFTVLDIVQLE